MFTKEIQKRFQDPSNVGDLTIANAEGQAKGEDCSDYILIKLYIEEGLIMDAKFQACGCPGAICTSDVFIDLIKGKNIKEALKIGEAEIAKALGVFPEEYLHCAKLPLKAFKRAVSQKQSLIIGISGGKGGTGKSTVATALAFALAKENKVLLVDADVDCPNDHLLLGVKRKSTRKVEQRMPRWDFAQCKQCGLCSGVCKTNAIVAIKGRDPIFASAQCNGCGACVLKCPSRAISWDRKEIGQIYEGRNCNVDLLSGELKANEPISEFVVNELNNIIKKKKDEYDYVIIDTAAGTHCPVIAALENCDQVLAVTEPTPLGRHDLELIIQLTKQMKKPTDLVINRFDVGEAGMIKQLADNYQSQIIAQIPYSLEIAQSIAEGKPIEHKEINKIIKYIIK